MTGTDERELVVVGAGIVGLVTALIAAEAGTRVTLLTAEPVGGGSSGRSAGIVSQLHGAAYSRMRGETARKNAQAYRLANADGFAWIEAALDRFGVAHERSDALLVADARSAARRVDDEHRAARNAGLAVEKVRGIELPFPVYGALRLADQIVVPPDALLAALAAAARAAGVELLEGQRVTDVLSGPGGNWRVQTDSGEWPAGRVVLATGTPILDRGLYALKTQPFRVLAMRGSGVEDAVPIVTALGVRDSHTIAQVGDAVVVTGGVHPNGIGGPETHRMDALERWSTARLEGFARTSAWSGQDYRPFNPIAFVGRLPRARGSVLFATGFDGWGLTHGAAAAIRIAADLLGTDRPAWATTIGRRFTSPVSQRIGISADAAAAGRRVTSVVRVVPADRRLLREGAGLVHRTADGIVATSLVGGTVRSVAGLCNRLGGALTWNDLERSWDCPVCGSRFAPDGAVLEGGARMPLKSLEVDPAEWGVAS